MGRACCSCTACSPPPGPGGRSPMCSLARGLAVTAPDLRGHGLSPSGQSYRLMGFCRGSRLSSGHVGRGRRSLAERRWPAGSRRRPLAGVPGGIARPRVRLYRRVRRDRGGPARRACDSPAPSRPPEGQSGLALGGLCRQKALAAANCSPFVNEAVLRDNRPWDYAGLLARAVSPVLVLGADDAAAGMLDPGLGQRIAASNARVTYRRIEATGHSLHRDRPQLVVDAVLEVL